MGAAERFGYYEQLEGLRRRPLLVYVTSARAGGVRGLISAEAIAEFQDQLQELEKPGAKQKFENPEAIDLLVVSNGGDPTVAWRLMSLLRERAKQIAVLVPQAAFSAATLLALGANEIVMHPNGNLGPVDPQITAPRPGGGSARFAFEDLAGVLEYADKLKLTDPVHQLHVFDRIIQEVGAVTVGFAARRSLLSLSMGEKLLRMHMEDKENDKRNPRAIAETLNKQFYDHGYPLSRTEAQDILGDSVVRKESPEVEDLMWKIWCDVERELRVREPFDLVSEWASRDEAADLLNPKTHDDVKYGVFPLQVTTAIIESTRLMSRHVIDGGILVTRTGVLKYDTEQLVARQGWVQHPLPGAASHSDGVSG